MKFRHLLAGVFLLIAGISLYAQDQVPEAGAGDAATDAGDAADSADSEATEDADEGPVGAAESRAADDLSIFVPTQEIAPDEQVLFPVDI